jgi:hypothetical protein
MDDGYGARSPRVNRAPRNRGSRRRARLEIASNMRRRTTRTCREKWARAPQRFLKSGPTRPWSASWTKIKHEKVPTYSITSSARASSVGGTSRPSALAVLRFRTRSNLVSCITGKSLGFSPLRILPA